MEDLVGIGKAAEKLLEVVSRGVGTLYRPRAIRKEADAKAYEIRTLGRATAEAAAESHKLEVLYLSNQVDSSNSSNVNITSRVSERLLNREFERQSNIERIADAAFQNLPSEVSDTPVSKDWTRRFFNIAEDVSEGEMQVLWARVLAGEVSRPGSFSTRTLNVLRDLSRVEAESFETACHLSFGDGYLLQAPRGRELFSEWLKDFGLPRSKLLSLQEAGLIHDAESNSPYMKVWAPEKRLLSLGARYKGLEVKFTTMEPRKEFEFVTIRFTSAGLELSRLVSAQVNEDFLHHVAKVYEATIEIHGP
jgi:hypothetical protein